MRGETEDMIAIEKEVGKSTVTKLWSLYRETGSYEPRPNPRGRKPALSSEELESVKKAIVQRPDITLSELIDQFSLFLSVSALSRIVRFKLGFGFKKNAITKFIFVCSDFIFYNSENFTLSDGMFHFNPLA